MLIDWFTVGAQILNFLILVWLLKHFLYHPVLDAIDAREALIAKKLSDADAGSAKAAQEQADFRQKNASFDREKVALQAQAIKVADGERQRLLDAARQDASKLSAELQDKLKQDAQALNQELGRRVRQEVFAITRKALGDLAGATLEERMVVVFVGRLQALSDDEKQKLSAALQAAAKPVVVCTRFDLAPTEQNAVTVAVLALLGKGCDIRFATKPDLVSGIELRTDGYKVAWSIDEYLTELESGIGELLKAKVPEQDAPEKAKTDAS